MTGMRRIGSKLSGVLLAAVLLAGAHDAAFADGAAGPAVAPAEAARPDPADAVYDETQPGADDPRVKEGFAAYRAGDFKKAYDIWLPLAEAGNAEAQALLADFYDRGMPPLHVDHCRAFDWYVKAGQNGDLKSQAEVAKRLANTFGGYQDIPIGYLWAAYALRAGYKPAQTVIDIYYKDRLSESDMAKLDQLLPDWGPTETRFGDLISMPGVPFVSGILDVFFPIRNCLDPKLIQHLINAHR